MTTTDTTAPSTSPTNAPKKPWFKRGWAIGLGGFLLGAIIGTSGAETADPKESPEYEAVAADLTASQDEVTAAEEQLATAEEDLAAAHTDLEEIAGDLPARERAVEDAEVELVERQAAVDKAEVALGRAEKAMVKREKAVGIAEKEIAANTIGGEGLFEVGSDMKPGLYKTSGMGDCYYAVLGDANGNNILSNNITSGPATVSVAAGQFFETSGCANWVLQR